jgi:hypothetical protein
MHPLASLLLRELDRTTRLPAECSLGWTRDNRDMGEGGQGVARVQFLKSVRSCLASYNAELLMGVLVSGDCTLRVLSGGHSNSECSNSVAAHVKFHCTQRVGSNPLRAPQVLNRFSLHARPDVAWPCLHMQKRLRADNRVACMSKGGGVPSITLRRLVDAG